MIMSSLQTLARKVAVVSGASSGIGAAIARELARRGATVVINYPWPGERKAAEDVRESLCAEARIVEADLSTVDGPRLLIKAIIKEFAPKDFLNMVLKHLEANPVVSRLGMPEEVAAAVAMLCEEQAGWINGAYIPVGGGMVMT
ncbi:hypothetical protein FANTH_14473 [Fusarium anthophilum]|uniref:SDR family oxidoreductase n=1 Tax=Fusarium anthophilum TaxID=48485 RepID=A0A8H5DM13_9HYPO|nr:hypothetical protein FANTH_14473 [Fusarium anthophilum]